MSQCATTGSMVMQSLKSVKPLQYAKSVGPGDATCEGNIYAD